MMTTWGRTIQRVYGTDAATRRWTGKEERESNRKEVSHLRLKAEILLPVPDWDV
jgi:hypothetical protein